MKTFNYTIKDEVGIHARPAGLLAKKAKEFESTIKTDDAYGAWCKMRRDSDYYS